MNGKNGWLSNACEYIKTFSCLVSASLDADCPGRMLGFLLGRPGASDAEKDSVRKRCASRVSGVKVCLQVNSPDACDTFQQDLDLCKVSERATAEPVAPRAERCRESENERIARYTTHRTARGRTSFNTAVIAFTSPGVPFFEHVRMTAERPP